MMVQLAGPYAAVHVAVLVLGPTRRHTAQHGKSLLRGKTYT